MNRKDGHGEHVMTQIWKRGGRRTARVLLAAMVLAPVAACDTDALLDVENPDIIDPEDLQTLQGAAALYNGALGEFALAKDGGAASGGPGIVEAGGWFTDEFAFSGTPPALREMDLRSVLENNSAWNNTYRNLHRARERSEQAARVLEQMVANPAADARIGEMWATSGLVYILLGEHYCSGIPFSTTEPEIVYGQPLPTQQVFEAALERLDKAAGLTAGDARITNLVRVARGRALLNNGRYAEAATAVAPVPTDFEYLTYHSTATNRQVNGLYMDNWEMDLYAVSDNEGINGLNFGTAGDPRVPTRNDGVSRFDDRTPMVRLLTLASRSAPTVTANGVEARLIEAEAALQAGDIGGFVAKLNEARAPWEMEPITDPGSQQAREDLLFRERAFALFNSGHRLGDLRRLVRQYARDWQTVYPIGPYHKDGLTRGTDLSIVIPQIERNNPNYNGCDKSQS